MKREGGGRRRTRELHDATVGVFLAVYGKRTERTGGVNTVLIGDDLPKLGADLVAGLASLNVNEFALWVGKREGSKVE